MPMLDYYLDVFLSRGKRVFYGVTVGGGLALIVLTSWLWWHYSYLNPQNVYWAAISNNLATSGVTKKTTTAGTNSQIEQYDQITLGSQNLVRSVTTTNQTGAEATKVVTEAIGTPTDSFSRYTSISTNRKNSAGQPLNFEPAINKWSKLNASASGSGAFASAVFDAIPIANLTASQRADVMKSIRQGNTYKTDFTKVGKERKNSRLYYKYAVEIAPDKYVELLKQVDGFMGLNQLKNLDPAQYQGSAPVQLTVVIDAVGHQLATVTYSDNARQVDYSAWGVVGKIDVPKDTISQADLQTKLSEILNEK